MRVPVGRIYRAFPELDRFTDDQCEMFVRAACRRGWRPWIHRAVLTVTVLMLIVILTATVIAVGRWIDSVLPYGLQRTEWFWVLATAGTVTIFSPLFFALPMRDWLLVRRLRRVIRARGSCPACSYTLLGVVLSDATTVTCPECGVQLDADPSLNEIITDDEGRQRFMPSAVHASVSFWTPRRRRIAKRAAIATGVFVFVVLPAAWGVYEIFLYRQALKARAERPGAAGILAFVESVQPDGVVADGPNGWDTIDVISIELSDARIATFSLPQFRADRVSAEPVFDFIWSGLPEDTGGTLRRRNQRSLDAALAMLDALETQGTLVTLDSLADHRRVVHNFTLGQNTPAVMLTLPSLGTVRQLARINAARMHLALEAGDLETFLAALESGLALARCCYHQPTLIESLVGDAITSLMHQRVQAAILQHPDHAWLDGIEAAIERQRPPVGPDHRFRGELLMGLDTICWMFSSTEHTRFGRFSPAIGGLVGGFGGSNPFNTRLGTYTENRDAYTASFQHFIDHAGTDAADRPAPPAREPSGLLLVEILEPTLSRVQRGIDDLNSRTRATRTMLALERYRLDNGAYPTSLDRLVSDYFDALPEDPWTGDPLVYQPHASAAEQSVYRLFSSGPDGTIDSSPENAGDDRPDDITFSPPGE